MDDLESELLAWAAKEQLWQRDLLRRLAQGELLGAADYRAYANEAERIELSKPAPWSSVPTDTGTPDFVSIDASHLQATDSGTPSVSVQKVMHLEGANDLAPGAAVTFAKSGLTIVAGRNGSGKSGYTRILKQVAASRGPERVLPNAFKPNIVPKAVITYEIDSAEAQDLTWQADASPLASPLQRVRVFDAKSAAVHLTTSTEVAYVPPTLQVLADYTAVLKLIGEAISDDLQRAQLSKRSWPALEVGVGLEVFKHLGEKSGIEALDKLAILAESETTELAELPAKLGELTVSDPVRLAAQARSRAGQLSTLARNITTISGGIDASHVGESLRVSERVFAAEQAMAEASKQIQDGAVLSATGSPKWRAMWLAAKEFSENSSDHEFPDLTDDAVCALCQQPIEAVARERFERFAKFMKSEAQTEQRKASELWQASIAALRALPVDSAVTQDLVELVGIYDKAISDTLLPLVARCAALRDRLIDGNPAGDMLEATAALTVELQHVGDSLIAAASEEIASAEKFGRSDSNALEAAKLQARESELKLRQGLSSTKSEIEGQHDLTIRITRLQSALKSCDTTAASKQNTKLSRDYVDKVCTAFSLEAKELGLDRVPVELIFDKSARGVSYIKVSLVGAPNISVQTVLSEGEQRVAAIAGFFADLTESGDGSTLVFDDPVSSLDQPYREAVARRLLLEAEQRQVLVFSHDFTFVQYLYEQRSALERSAAAEQPAGNFATIEYIHIARSSSGAGEPTTAEQWRHVSVAERIKRLNVRIENVGVLYRAKDDTAYEKEARDIVGAIRETWEYFVEQELLDGIVQRHERAIQTQRLKRLVDISDADVLAVEGGMKISSRWLTGHAAPANDATQIITPDQLKAELQKLVGFRAGVLERRKGKK